MMEFIGFIALGVFVLAAVGFCIGIYQGMKDTEHLRRNKTLREEEQKRIAAYWKARGRVIKPRHDWMA